MSADPHEPARMAALDTPERRASRACCACRWFRHDARFKSGASCSHPAYRVPTDWGEAIQRGQPCGGDNAPLWDGRRHG